MTAAARTFDYIIVGGGAAGCVLAARLSENPSASVLLMEAGPDYGPNEADWPADIRDGVGIKTEIHPWGYVQANDTRTPPLALPRAKVIGGSAAINGCMWLYGSASDYDGWGALGNLGWSFDAILDGYRRAESDPLGGGVHGTGGALPGFRPPAAGGGPTLPAV